METRESAKQKLKDIVIKISDFSSEVSGFVLEKYVTDAMEIAENVPAHKNDPNHEVRTGELINRLSHTLHKEVSYFKNESKPKEQIKYLQEAKRHLVEDINSHIFMIDRFDEESE